MTRLAEVKADRDAETRRADLFLTALHLTQTTKADHVERISERDSPGRYVIEAYGLTRAHGGILVTRFVYPSQLDSIRADYLDQWADGLPGMPVEFRSAGERFRMTRDRLTAHV
mgnify:CR=1 FL=1